MTHDYSEDIEGLQSQLADLKDKESEIAFQISTVKSKARETGVFAEPMWFKKANHALRKTRGDIDRLQRAVRLLKKRWDYEQRQSLEYHFLQVSRRHLDPPVFEQLMLKAQGVMKNTP